MAPKGLTTKVAMLVVAAAGPSGSRPYELLWSSGGIPASELAAAGFNLHAVFNWSPHDGEQPSAWNCSTPLIPNQTKGPCILSLWPLIAGAGAPGKSNVNGGVPQAANLTAHQELLRRTLPGAVSADFDGIAAIDFENWTPIWENDGSHDAWHSAAYRQLSLQLVVDKHPSLSHAQAQAQAKQNFEHAAVDFFVQTLRVCREVRPRARWGFYGFPNSEFYPCDNQGCGYSSLRAGRTLRGRNDLLQPLWDEVDVILPSIYMQILPGNTPSSSRNAYINHGMVNNTVTEALRLSKNSRQPPPAVFAFMYSFYNSQTQNVTLTAADTKASVEIPYYLGADGLVVWGDPGYIGKELHHPHRVAQFQQYFDSTLAPELKRFAAHHHIAALERPRASNYLDKKVAAEGEIREQAAAV